MESEIISVNNIYEETRKQLSSCEDKLKEVTLLFETEKDKNEKANVKLKSYREKILKCSACINQLKNTRFILTKTVKEYSENIPKWQKDIIKASHMLDEQNANLTKEIESLRHKLNTMEQKYIDISNVNVSLNNKVKEFESQNNSNMSESLELQIKALETEKSILVKEKLTARDYSLELENKIITFTEQLNNLQYEKDLLSNQLTFVSEELKQQQQIIKNQENENTEELNSVRKDLKSLKDEYEQIKKENQHLTDLNGMLKDEVETLKLSLEQPNDGEENFSDINASLQADIVKLETKLSAYKQENAALLIETKETRGKLKEFEAILSENDDTKAKLISYKTENAELLNEMKEINQALKERGEVISKQQKAIAEMERLIETLEKDRDDINEEKEKLQNTILTLENDLRNATQLSNKESEAAQDVVIERNYALKNALEKDAIILSLKEEIEKWKNQQSSSSKYL